MFFIKYRGITSKFLLYFTLIIVIPIMMINIFSMNAFRQIIINNARDLIRHEQESVAVSLEQELKTYNRILAAIVYNSKSIVLDHVTSIHRASDPMDKYNLTESMDEKIRLIMYASDQIDGVYFIFDDESYYYYNNPLAVPLSTIMELQLYRDVKENPDKTQKGNLIHGLTTDSEGRYTLLFGVHPTLSNYRSDVDMVMLSAFTKVLPKVSSSTKTDIEGMMYIVDVDGHIMYCEDPSLQGLNIKDINGLSQVMKTGSVSYTEEVNGEETLINIYAMDDVGWRIVNLVSQSYVTRQADRITALSLYINISMIACFCLFTIFFFRGMIRPINELIQGMNYIEQGDLGHRLSVSGSNELRRLGQSFNNMSNRLASLISENQIKEYEKMQAEIDALQYQINPHFIVNSISTIKFMAMVSKNKNIQRVSEVLMTILNTSFRHRDHFNSLNQELSLVKSYIEIMLIRYGYDFEVRYKIDETLMEHKVLKLILQPIIENSITHGLSEKDGNKILMVRVNKEEGHILIEVIDNGIGMEENKAQALCYGGQDKAIDRQHIGICNIQNRIILNHGDGYGLTIRSRVGCYMKVTLKLPMKEE